MKKISLDTSVYTLAQDCPEIIPVMVSLGLDGVTNPAILKTAGRFMTLRKGAQMKEIPVSKLISALHNANIEVQE